MVDGRYVLYTEVSVYCFFFFKQKTAYEMRISDWSSDVCSSDLCLGRARPRHGPQTVWIGLRSRSDRGHLAASATRMLRATAPGSDRSRQTAMPLFLKRPRPPDRRKGWRRNPGGISVRKSGVTGKSGAVRVTLGVRRILKEKQ